MIAASFRSLGQRYRLPLALCGNLLLCAAILVACSDNNPSSPSGNTDQPSSMAIIVTSTPSTGNVHPTETRQYAIQVKNSAGTVLPSLTAATWSVNDTTNASITQTGLATCLRAVTANVTVTATGPSGSSYSTLSATATLPCTL